jgi:aldose 1-epimerase
MSTNKTVELRVPGASVRIESAYGGRLSSWRVGEIELLWQPDGQMPGASHPFGWGSFVMAPYAGRIPYGQLVFDQRTYELPISMEPHAIHGTVYEAEWTVEDVYETDDASVCDLSVELQSPWPFVGRLTHRIALAAAAEGQSGTLTQHLSLTAADAMPATMGWHPWFPRNLVGATGPVEWSFDHTGVAMFQRDVAGATTPELVPIPAPPWDDCFLGVGEVTVRWPGLIELLITHDCPVVVLFDGLDHAVCVEPQTGPPNAPKLWPSECRVEVGQEQRASTTWSWKLAGR